MILQASSRQSRRSASGSAGHRRPQLRVWDGCDRLRKESARELHGSNTVLEESPRGLPGSRRVVMEWALVSPSSLRVGFEQKNHRIGSSSVRGTSSRRGRSQFWFGTPSPDLGRTASVLLTDRARLLTHSV